jgi:hypothetical protein
MAGGKLTACDGRWCGGFSNASRLARTPNEESGNECESDWSKWPLGVHTGIISLYLGTPHSVKRPHERVNGSSKPVIIVC